MASADEHLRERGQRAGESGGGIPCRNCACTDREGDVGEDVPEWLTRLDPAAVRRLDVRPLLATGEAPFSAVMEMADSTGAEGALIIEAPFNPQPLRRVLAGKHFSTYGERLGPDHWQIWCCRGEAHDPPAPAARVANDANIWRSGDVVHIDVRGLETPRPLVAILTLIDGGAHHGHIVVHHNRDPIYLYPELEERGWRYARMPSPEDEVRLELRGPR